MYILFLIISFLSLIAIIAFGVLALVQFVNNNKDKILKQIVFACISFFVMVVSFIAFIVAIPSTENKTEDIIQTSAESNFTQKEPEETPEEEVTTEQIVEEEELKEKITWTDKIKEIILKGGTETEKFEATMVLANDYTTNQDEVEQFKAELINDFKNGRYLKDITNDEYMLSMIFKTRIVETYYLYVGSPTADFAFDMQQNLKYTYRGVDDVNSEAVKANEEQMKKALEKIE